MSVCRTVIDSVQPVWPIVLQGKILFTFLCSALLPLNYFHIRVQESSKNYFVIFQTAGRQNNLCVVGIIIFNRTIGYSQF